MRGGGVKARLLENAQEIIIQVKDTGEGIDEKDLPFVFDRFYQSGNNKKARQTGSGVGLALSKEIAKLHGGDIRVTSKLNEGSTFELILPTSLKVEVHSIQTDDIQESEETSLQPKINKENTDKIILLVDDNSDMREYIITILSDYYSIMQARDGKEAIKLMERSKPDLVITDIMMPRMDGVSLARKLKDTDVWKNIPIITLTALSDEKTRVETLRIGVDDYLVKPFNPEELLVRIQNLIQNADERKSEDTNEEERSFEEKLLKRLEEEVYKNISDFDFNVVRLAESGELSERQLYRYLKSMTGLTPANFIKEIKLQKAFELANKKTYPTAVELSHAVGFQHSGYFINVFKKRFGKSPSSLLKE